MIYFSFAALMGHEVEGRNGDVIPVDERTKMCIAPTVIARGTALLTVLAHPNYDVNYSPFVHIIFIGDNILFF